MPKNLISAKSSYISQLEYKIAVIGIANDTLFKFSANKNFNQKSDSIFNEKLDNTLNFISNKLNSN
ncbi:MAG: hypothetical protein ACWA42_02375, partial [Lutibacter sp.]